MKRGKPHLLLMLALAVSLFFTGFREQWASLFAAVFFFLSVLAAANAISRSSAQVAVILALGSAGIFPIWELAVPNRTAAETINSLLWLGMTFYVGVIVFRSLIQAREVGGNEVCGAISVFLLTGIFFGIVYQLVLLFDPRALYFNPTNFTELPPRDGDLFYYSFITLSTVGYGDVSPASPLSRSISMLESIIGVMYVATMIARFVSIQSSRAFERDRQAPD